MGPNKKKSDAPKTGGTFSNKPLAESPRQLGARRAGGQKVNTLGPKDAEQATYGSNFKNHPIC